MKPMGKYVVSVGMEVHAELLTNSKMFCRCPVEFGGMPNTRTCPVCLGLPGTLPVPNKAAVEFVLKAALALNCQIAKHSVFHRKNYFYPDLPKGYQVSQYGETNPIGYHGWLEIPDGNGGTKKVKIARVHLEEDTGKLLHLPGGGAGVDYNRAGVPLMEIVTAFPPDIESPDDARNYLMQLRQTLIYLGVCDGKMEQGSMRCEPNISVRIEGATEYGTKTELKNLNSFKSVQNGVAFEHERQGNVLDEGGTIYQETRGWNEDTQTSYVMRVKESEQDYRYFPDPDLVPMEFSDEYIESVRASLPELPLAKQLRYENDLGLSHYDAGVLVSDLDWSRFFEAAISLGGDAKLITNWMNGDFARLLNETGKTAEESNVSPQHIVDLIQLIEGGKISGKTAKEVFEESFTSGDLPSQIVERKGLGMISDSGAIELMIQEVMQESKAQVEQYRSGKVGLIGFFVGQVMKKSDGQADPKMVQEILRRELDG